jgi:hypothetical protein
MVQLDLCDGLRIPVCLSECPVVCLSLSLSSSSVFLFFSLRLSVCLFVCLTSRKRTRQAVLFNTIAKL